MRIMIVDDKVRMASLLRRAMEREGYLTVVAHDGETALKLAYEHHLDAIVLDVMLPGLDGFSVLQRLRESAVDTPTIFLTARDTNGDIVHGLDLGADDYLTKPFDLKVLLARLRALTRRKAPIHPGLLHVGNLVLRSDLHSIECSGEMIALTRTEFALMETLMQNAGRIVSKEILVEAGWGLGGEMNEHNLYVFIASLRSKIQLSGEAVSLQTVRGVGYLLRSGVA
ncbi:response regulator transcription factor [Acidipila sp. 4G-K13]|nr:response regulator transcription factor [Paracidobacterium acidisoli]